MALETLDININYIDITKELKDSKSLMRAIDNSIKNCEKQSHKAYKKRYIIIPLSN